MNAWDIDPSSYAPLWQTLRQWYRLALRKFRAPRSAHSRPPTGSRP